MDDVKAELQRLQSLVAEADQQFQNGMELVEKTAALSQNKVEIAKKLETAMGAIKSTNSELSDLQLALQTIQSKTRIINSIVMKMQVLSFNASIEAARAGEFGKGFALIAEEVGRLAQSSGLAAKEIDTLLSDSQDKAQAVVESAVSKTGKGIDVSKDVVEGFVELSQAVEEISTALKKIDKNGKTIRQFVADSIRRRPT